MQGGYIKSRAHVQKSSSAATVDNSFDEGGEGNVTESGQLVNVNNDKAVFATGKSQHEKDLMVVTTATEYLKLRRTYQGTELDWLSLQSYRLLTWESSILQVLNGMCPRMHQKT